jgi:hypothetical protein
MRTNDSAGVEMHHVAERLAQEFDTLPVTTVIAALSDCIDAWPDAGAAFIETAVRARLADKV